MRKPDNRHVFVIRMEKTLAHRVKLKAVERNETVNQMFVSMSEVVTRTLAVDHKPAPPIVPEPPPQKPAPPTESDKEEPEKNL